MSEVILRGGEILDTHKKKKTRADVWIRAGKIAAIDKPGQIPRASNAKEIDARKFWILPGCIDVHVHLREPGQEYKETIASGTRAAVAGGFTTVACMANTVPVNDNATVTAFIREKARQYGHCRVIPIGAVTRGLKGQEMAEIGGMVEEGAMALSDDGRTVMNSYLMRKAMEYAKTFGVPVISHAEDENLVGQGVMNEGRFSMELGLRGIPAAAEEILVAREIALCRLTNCPVHIAHISTEVAIEHLRRAKEAGLPVTAEATPHHLSLTEEKLVDYNTNFKMAPPLRSQSDRRALVEAFASGLVDVLATDHAPHGIVEKEVEFESAANGIIGLETALSTTFSLVKSGAVSEWRWVEGWTRAPARLLGLKDAGEIRVGRRADLTVFDPNAKWKFESLHVFSKSHNSPFLGTKQSGRVVLTIVEGKVVHAIDF